MLHNNKNGELVKLLTEVNSLTAIADDLMLSNGGSINNKEVRFFNQITSEIYCIKESGRKLEDYIRHINSV